MEPVLRSIELATSMTNNTDLDALLALRLEGGHLPQADLGGPHPFRGSGPGARDMACPAVPPRLRQPALMPASQRMAPDIRPGSTFSCGKESIQEELCTKPALTSAAPSSVAHISGD